MGHYLSEMEGEPFEKQRKILNRLGKILLELNNIKYESVTSCYVEWIVKDPKKRKWVRINYFNKYPCTTTFEYKKVSHIIHMS